MAKGADVPLESFSKVIEAIYDCALTPDRWPETLALIIGLCRVECCALGVMDLGNQRSELTYQAGIEEHISRLYADKYAALNPYHIPASLQPVGTVVTSAMLVDPRELLESRFYREFLKPQGLRDSFGVKVLQTDKRMGAWAGHRLESQGPLGNTELYVLRLLAPHVCRSVAISDALNLKTVHADTLEATLDALASGVYLTDRESRVVYMNRAAERQVKTSNALRIVNNRLTAVDYETRAVLSKAIAEATADETEIPSAGITVALPAGETVGLVATVLPLNRGKRQDLCGSHAATAGIFMQDPIVVPPLPGEAFAKLYGLTGSELRVLLAMAPGLSVREAAEILGIGDSTAKTHLHNIFVKTGTSKQTELLHLFMSSTPPVQGSNS